MYNAGTTGKAGDDTYRTLRIGDTEVIAGISGVGIKNGRTAAHELISRFKPEIVINAGIAGALHADMKVGNIVVGEWVYRLKKNQKLNLVCHSDMEFRNAITGGILTYNRFVDRRTTKKCLYEKTGAMVVDMETWGIAESCQKAGKELIAVKSVSDTSTENLPPFGKIMDAGGNLRYVSASHYFVSNPYMLYKYLQFKYVNMRTAINNINDFIVSFVKSCNSE